MLFLYSNEVTGILYDKGCRMCILHFWQKTSVSALCNSQRKIMYFCMLGHITLADFFPIKVCCCVLFHTSIQSKLPLVLESGDYLKYLLFRYVNKAMVQDLETGQKWHFLCSSWLAIDVGECTLDKVFPAATEMDLTRFRWVTVVI